MARKKNTPTRSAKSKPKTQTKIFKISNKSFKVYVTTLQDIKKLQNSTKNSIPKLPFSKVIREIMMQFSEGGYNVQATALQALQEAAEIYLIQLFEDAYKCSCHARRITLKPMDMALALALRGVRDPGRI